MVSGSSPSYSFTKFFEVHLISYGLQLDFGYFSTGGKNEGIPIREEVPTSYAT